MAFIDLLLQTVEVRRRSGNLDRFGQPVDINPSKTSAADVVGSYPCRVYTKSGGLVNQERSRDVFEDLRQIFTMPDADIQEDDSLTVTDTLTGAVVLPISKVKLKYVVYDGQGPHHLELDVIVQRGPS
jgi:hypothetical protein